MVPVRVPMSFDSKRMNILVIGVGGNVGQGILKAVALSALSCRVVGACISADSMGLYTVDKAYLCPLASDARFLDWLIDVCHRERVDAVLSGVEPVLSAIAPASERIRTETNAVCIVSRPESLAVCGDKLATCVWLKEHGFAFPRYAAAPDVCAVDALVRECGFPLIAKPRRGKGSRGVAKIPSRQALNEFTARDDYVLEEYLGHPDHEYTAACFSDRTYKVRGAIVMRRQLLDGTTVRAEAGDFPEIREEAIRIAEALQPMGPCNLQMRLRQGRAVCFEINNRFSGTTPIRARFGFNDVESALRHFVLGEAINDLPRIARGVCLRYWNELYVDPDVVEELQSTSLLAERPSSRSARRRLRPAHMRVLVTGATGQVGRAVAGHLRAKGYSVLGLSRHNTEPACQEAYLEAKLGDPGFSALAGALEPCDAIVHAAASLSNDDPELALTNCVGTRQILDLGLTWGACPVVFISSAGVIGRPAFQPITEDHPPAPSTAYHCSKLFGEFLVADAAQVGIRGCSLRISSPCGPGTPTHRILGVFVRRAMSNLPLKILGAGTRKQNYVDVRDIAQAVECALNTGASGIINVASARSVANIELARMCIEEMASASTMEFDGRPDPEEGIVWDFSIEKARQQLGYQPRLDVRDSILAMAREYANTHDTLGLGGVSTRFT